MAHLYDPRRIPTSHAPSTHVHFIAMLLLAALVIIVTLGVRDHRPPPQPRLDTNTPMTAPR